MTANVPLVLRELSQLLFDYFDDGVLTLKNQRLQVMWHRKLALKMFPACITFPGASKVCQMASCGTQSL